MSLAKFVRAPASDEAGVVGFSTGVAIVDHPDLSGINGGSEDFEGSFYFFPFEGALSLWLGEYYDLSLSVNSTSMLFLEGSLGIDLGGVRVALLHGVGVDMWDQVSGPDTGWVGILHYGFSGGLLIQSTLFNAGTLFLGARYAYAEIDYLYDPPGIDHWAWTHSVTGSLGFTFITGFLRITPEFILSYGHHYAGDSGEPTYDDTAWVIIPTINLSASF
jgi:hypothetical protein